MAQADDSSTTNSSLAALLMEAGVPKARITQRLATYRIAVLSSVPAAFFSTRYLKDTAGKRFQSALMDLVIAGRLRVQDDDDGLIFYEPLPHGRAFFIERMGKR
jgi:hypothetical protein